MNKDSRKSTTSLGRLIRFLVWYGAAVALLFYGLPVFAGYLQSGYESISGTVKLIALAGFLSGIAVWHVRSHRDRLRTELDTGVMETG